ncbi:MAG: hypothetical protein NC393_01310 [Clostridium sp.]|nr:hypothetical protein [Clostridium sp.]MCM1170741.1 hypothetical protein [Clostridium sp.]MCM1207614.1 hypothetical protein [Ruminococcus sp.]
MLTSYKKNLISDNFINCRSILGEQITEITLARQVLSNAYYTECNDSFSDDFVKTTYSNLSTTCSDLYNANVENLIALGRTKTWLYNDDTEYSEKILEIVEELEEMQCTIEVFSNKIYSGTNNGPLEVEDIYMLLPEDRKNAFKNGNPWISEDYQYLYYNGEAYKIVTSPYQSINPYPVDDGPIFVQGPTMIYSKEFNGDYFDWAEAFAGLNNVSIDDMSGAMPGAIPTTRLGSVLDAVFLIDNFYQAGNKDLSVTAEFYQCGDERRVVLGVDFSDYQKAIEQYAGKTMSLYDQCRDQGNQFTLSNDIADVYEELTGNQRERGCTYDFMATLDEHHLQDTHYMTLYFDENGEMRAHTNIYDGDSYQIVKRTGLFKQNIEVVYEVKPNSESAIDSHISETLLEGLSTGFN